jgi:uncharacterized protein (DUF1501 family)
MDGLSLVAPTMDTYYREQRGSLRIEPPSVDPRVRDLDGFFALGPAAQALYPLYSAGRLAFVHRTGMPLNALSHFDAMQNMESGRRLSPLGPIPSAGWAGRFILPCSTCTAKLRAVNHGAVQPKTLVGADKALPIPNPESYDLPSSWSLCNSLGNRRYSLEKSHLATQAPVVGPAGLATLDTLDLLSGISWQTQTQYPAGPIGAQLRRTAALIKSQATRPGLELDVVMIDYGGWDHHSNLSPNQPDAHGIGFYSMMEVLAQGLAALDADLVNHPDDYVVVVMTEFGRRVQANGAAGVDHGAGNCWIVMGSGVNGGQVYADGWQSIDVPTMEYLLDENRNLDIAIPYQDLLGEILVERFGLDPSRVGTVFEGHSNYQPRGIIG